MCYSCILHDWSCNLTCSCQGTEPTGHNQGVAGYPCAHRQMILVAFPIRSFIPSYPQVSFPGYLGWQLGWDAGKWYSGVDAPLVNCRIPPNMSRIAIVLSPTELRRVYFCLSMPKYCQLLPGKALINQRGRIKWLTDVRICKGAHIFSVAIRLL